jgi:hypothetical protein
VLESVLRAYLGAYSQAGWECAIECDWERLECVLGNTVKQAGSVPSSAIWSVLVSMPGSVLENVLGGVLGSVSQAGWECTIKCNQECTSERTWERAMKCIWQFY